MLSLRNVPEAGKSIGILTARQTEIVNCNWEGSASRAPPKVGQICVLRDSYECKYSNYLNKMLTLHKNM